MGNLREIEWPRSRRYKSGTEWEPAGFFSDGLLEASRFDLMLGFFSSTAINVLADGFAAFIANGGRMRMVVNDILSIEDWNAFHAAEDNSTQIPYFDLSDIQQLKAVLSQRGKHFFECLSWMIRNNRIEIKIVVPQSGVGIAHTKCGLFSDGTNSVAFEGSCNFSRTALLQNNESLSVFCSWDGELDKCRVDCVADDFEKTFSGNDNSVKYLKVDEVATQITDSFEQKQLSELIADEREIVEEELSSTVEKALQKAKKRVLEALKSHPSNNEIPFDIVEEPHFPYPSGPRDYQKEAFENWKINGQKGIFAMATGTGKTLTSLNCLLIIYQKFHFYKALILVPTITLVDQWEEECERFHFQHIIKVSSKNPNWKSEIDAIKIKEDFNVSIKEPSFIIIATYASFARESIFQELVGFSKKTCRQMLLIADEAHNMGSGRILDRLGGVKFLRRIGLSATPERQFDDVGNRAIMGFFGCQNGYTFEYSMQDAIDNGFLCRYKYYPHLVRLNDSEMTEYLRISLQLAKFYNSDNEGFPMSDEILKRLLLKRKRIVHKAKNKEEIFRDIVMNRYLEKGDLKYTLVYVPEGAKPDDNTSDVFDVSETVANDDYTDSLIDTYTQIVQEVSKTTTVKKFTSDVKGRNEILDKFAKGEIEVLTSMKCLDEGVDVPRSEMAVFCASTGNPRQFIQRRGRILRKHPDKHIAIIHDLVVAPEVSRGQENYNMERSLLKGELKRVRDFAILSENADFAYTELEEILTYYNLPLF